MKDIDILKTLLNGNHLNELEKERALQLIYLLKLEIDNRV